MTEGVNDAVRPHVSRWGKLPWLPFEVLVAYLLVVLGAFNLIDPEVEVAGTQLVSERVEALTYLLSGIFMIVGLWRIWHVIELFGLVLLIVGWGLNTAAGVLSDGPEALRDVFLFLGVAAAAGTRIYQMARGRLIVQMESA
jgi:hypothetical protein